MNSLRHFGATRHRALTHSFDSLSTQQVVLRRERALTRRTLPTMPPPFVRNGERVSADF